MNLRILPLFAALVTLAACGPIDETTDTEVGALDGAEAEQALSAITADEGRAIIMQGFNDAKGNEAQRTQIIARAFTTAGQRMAPGDVVTVIAERMPYAPADAIIATMKAKVFLRATPKDRRELHLFIGDLTYKVTANKTKSNGQLDYPKLKAAQREYMPTVISLITKTREQLTQHDVLNAVVRAVWPMPASPAELTAVLKKAGIQTAPAGRGLWHGNVDWVVLQALFGGWQQDGSTPPHHDLSSATSFEASLFVMAIEDEITWRDQWASIEGTMYGFCDTMNRIAKETGKEPIVAMGILKARLTAEEYSVLLSMRAARKDI